MRNTTIDTKINNYLVQLNSKEKQAVLNVIKTFVENRSENNLWEDDAFIAEMDRRTAEYESGKINTLTLDQLETGARTAFKAKTASKK